MVLISSPHKKSGLLWDKFKAHFGKDGDSVLVINASSLQLNPLLDPAMIAEKREEDPQAAIAEWDGQFRDDVAAFVSRDVIESLVETGVVMRPPLPRQRYHAFCDPAGGSGGDSFAMAISHRETGSDGPRYILDCLIERKPPFGPDAAIGEMCGTLKVYGCSKVTGDRWAKGFPPESFKRHGVSYEVSDRPKSDIYLTALPLLTSGMVDLLDDKRLIAQLCGLERRTSRGSGDSSDHPRGLHDDVANAAMGALVQAMVGKAPMRISEAAVLAAGMPMRPPLIAFDNGSVYRGGGW